MRAWSRLFAVAALLSLVACGDPEGGEGTDAGGGPPPGTDACTGGACGDVVAGQDVPAPPPGGCRPGLAGTSLGVEHPDCPAAEPYCRGDGTCASCDELGGDPWCADNAPAGQTACLGGACRVAECGAEPTDCDRYDAAVPARGACNPYGRCVACDEVAADYCATTFGDERGACIGGRCASLRCPDGNHEPCPGGYYCADGECLPGCASGVTSGPGGCDSPCGAETPRVCRENHTCLCLLGFFPGTGGQVDPSDGCLARSGAGYCLQSDRVNGMSPTASRPAPTSGRYTLQGTLLLGD